MCRLLAATLLAVSACAPEEVHITPTRISRESCTARWTPCLASEDTNGDGVQNSGETWSGMCTAVDQCTPCTGPCATLVFTTDVDASVQIGAAMSPMTVELQDPAGAIIEHATGDVAIDIDAPPAGVYAYGALLAALNQGSAVFANVHISRVATDLRLRATWEGAQPALSSPFATQPVCAAGMSAHWPLTETTGSSFADLAGGNDAACTTCPTWDQAETAWQFAANSGIDVTGVAGGPFDWSDADDLAVELWLRFDTDACTSETEVAVGREGGTSDLHWWLGCGGVNQRLSSYWQDTSGGAVGLKGPTIDTRWHHVVLQRAFSPPRRQLVIDGELIAVSSDALAAFDEPVTADLNIGWLNLGAGYHLNGHLAHVALYDRPLPHSEIMAHRSLGRASTYCDVVPPVCGDTRVDAGEGCDDGNTVDGDGCSATCARESRNCPADLLAYWRLDGTGLDRFDDAVDDAHLDCSFYDAADAGPYCPAATAGIIDGAQELDGVGAGLVLPAPAVAVVDRGPPDSFSVEAWMRPADGSTCTGNQVVVGRTAESTPSAYWWLGCDGPSGTAHADIRDIDATANTGLAGPVITDYAWHHLVLTVDAGADTVSLFVDGVHAETVGIPFTSGFSFGDRPLEIGVFGGDYHFEGNIDAVAFYGRALPLPEIANHWAAGAGADICTH